MSYKWTLTTKSHQFKKISKSNNNIYTNYNGKTLYWWHNWEIERIKYKLKSSYCTGCKRRQINTNKRYLYWTVTKVSFYYKMHRWKIKMINLKYKWEIQMHYLRLWERNFRIKRIKSTGYKLISKDLNKYKTSSIISIKYKIKSKEK